VDPITTIISAHQAEQAPGTQRMRHKVTPLAAAIAQQHSGRTATLAARLARNIDRPDRRHACTVDRSELSQLLSQPLSNDSIHPQPEPGNPCRSESPSRAGVVGQLGDRACAALTAEWFFRLLLHCSPHCCPLSSN
jgi:hypothetical protein